MRLKKLYQPIERRHFLLEHHRVHSSFFEAVERFVMALTDVIFLSNESYKVNISNVHLQLRLLTMLIWFTITVGAHDSLSK